MARVVAITVDDTERPQGVEHAGVQSVTHRTLLAELDKGPLAVNQIEQLQCLSKEDRFSIRVIAQVLPFRVNQYVIDNLIAFF